MKLACLVDKRVKIPKELCEDPVIYTVKLCLVGENGEFLVPSETMMTFPYWEEHNELLYIDIQYFSKDGTNTERFYTYHDANEFIRSTKYQLQSMTSVTK